LLATGLTPEDGLAVICLYRPQNTLVRRETSAIVEQEFAGLSVDVDALVCDTVEIIQGGERDVILVSLTSSDPDHLTHHLAFLHDPRRFNVAITRPRLSSSLSAVRPFFSFSLRRATAALAALQVRPRKNAGISTAWMATRSCICPKYQLPGTAGDHGV